MSEPKALGITKIKPCPWPWCTGRGDLEPFVKDAKGYHFVYCEECERSGPWCDNITAAIDAWNEAPRACQCRACVGSPDGWMLHGSTFIVCRKCGNKRCPHANHHRYRCTGSNEPGQPGSAYE